VKNKIIYSFFKGDKKKLFLKMKIWHYDYSSHNNAMKDSKDLLNQS